MPIDFDAAAALVLREAERLERNAEAFNTKDYDDMKPMRDSFLDTAKAMRMILMERQTLLTANGMLSEANDSLKTSFEGTECDLFLAVSTAYRRGATEWTRLNYPHYYQRLIKSDEKRHEEDGH